MNTIQCYLAQYIPNLMRGETTNVGVVIQHESQVLGRFFAETILANPRRHQTHTSRGKPKKPHRSVQVDKKVAIQRVLHPGIYRQWIEYWRYQMAFGVTGLQAALEEEHSNFALVKTAHVSNLQGGTLNALLDECYRLMVDPANDTRPDHQPLEPTLFHTIRDEFDKSGILASRGTHIAPNPVIAHAPVSGRVAQHEASFVQRCGGELVVMQVVNIRPSQTKRSIGMSAQATAYMLGDVRRAREDKGIKTVAIFKSEAVPRSCGHWFFWLVF